MKKALLSISALLFSGMLFAQPNVDWRNYSWIQNDYNSLNTVSQRESDYDWWYDHCTGYQNPLTKTGHIGYITCGVGKYRASMNSPLTYDERGPLINGQYQGGCAYDVAPALPSNSCDYDFDNGENPISGKQGLNFNQIGKINPNGTMGYLVTMNSRGEYVRAKQLADGTYLTVGSTISTRKKNGMPLFYNPTGNNPSNYFKYNKIFSNGIPHQNKGHWDIMKFDGANGFCIFNFIYGIYTFPKWLDCLNKKKQQCYFSSGQAIDFVQEKTAIGNIAVVGYATNNQSVGNAGKAAIIKIDNNGKVLAKRFLDQSTDGFRSVARSIEYAIINGNGYYFIAITHEIQGNGAKLVIYRLPANFTNSTPLTIIQTFTSPHVSYKQCTSYSMILKGNILFLSYINKCNNVWWGGDNFGELWVASISISSNNIILDKKITNVRAFDLKARIIELSDGNLGLVSSVQPQSWQTQFSSCTVPNYGCGALNTNFWNTDTYVAVLKPNLDLIWEKNYDVDDPIDCIDIPTSQTNRGGNFKRHECMYGISEAPDKGLVLSGNSSGNYDDNYMIKLQHYPVPPACSPFQSVYTWGPFTSNGDKSLIEQHLEIYLNSLFPPSVCPPPNPNVPNSIEVKKCNPFPFNNGVPTAACLFKEFIMTNQTGGLGTSEMEYPSSVITDCELKAIADNAVTQILTGYYCSCQSTYGSIVPNFDVECIFTSNSGNPANPVKRAIYINTTYRCCGKCK
jgi:hypothetical protein